MNGGATVRRFHREREVRLQHPGTRRMMLPPALNRNTITADLAPGFMPVGTAPIPPIAVKAPFPLSMASVLGVNASQGTIVIDGQLGRFHRHQQSPADMLVAFGGVREYVHFEASVEDLLAQTIRARLPSIRQWLSQAGKRLYAELDGSIAPLSTAAVDGVDAFVNERLIPFIKDYVEEREGIEELPHRLLVESTVERVLPALDKCFAFISGRWLRLIPFFGRPKPGQHLLKLGNQYMIGIQSQPASVVVTSYNTALQDAVRAVFATLADDGDDDSDSDDGECDIYRHEPYAVIRTPRGRCFVCQRLPPYAVEGIDKKLYYFDSAEIGIHIATTQVRSVITSACVQVLHSYRHMFVGTLGIGNFICMPREYSYYQDLNRQPLEGALLEHLESARMTLCAGYQPANSSVHRIQSVGRRTISLSEARKRNLPVYWYYEPRRGARSKVMSMFV